MRPDCTRTNGRVLFDMTDAPADDDGIDGIKVIGAGTRFGTVRGPEHPHNMALGDDDGRTLYMMAPTGVYRIRLTVAGLDSAFGARATPAGAPMSSSDSADAQFGRGADGSSVPIDRDTSPWGATGLPPGTGRVTVVVVDGDDAWRSALNSLEHDVFGMGGLSRAMDHRSIEA